MSHEGFAASAPFYGTSPPRNLSETLQGACPIVASFGGRDPLGRGGPECFREATAAKQITTDIKVYPRRRAPSHHGFRVRPGCNRGRMAPRLRVLRRAPRSRSNDIALSAAVALRCCWPEKCCGRTIPRHSVREGNKDTAVTRSIVDVVVRRGDLGERVGRCDGDAQRAGPRGFRQVNSGLLFGFSGEVIAA
jgi:hypothetical protein